MLVLFYIYFTTCPVAVTSLLMCMEKRKFDALSILLFYAFDISVCVCVSVCVCGGKACPLNPVIKRTNISMRVNQNANPQLNTSSRKCH